MKITNIGAKIVNVGAAALLPGEVMDVGNEFENNATIELLAKMKLISITGKKEEVAAKKAAAEAAKKSVEEAAAKKAAEEAAKNNAGV